MASGYDPTNPIAEEPSPYPCEPILGKITELVNLTPHPVNLMQDGEFIESWQASDSRVWCRVEEQGELVGSVLHRGQEISVFEVAEGLVENLPPRVVGRGYIVSRTTAAAVLRSDFFFPHKQVRDNVGRVVGFQALGRLASTASSMSRWVSAEPTPVVLADNG